MHTSPLGQASSPHHPAGPQEEASKTLKIPRDEWVGVQKTKARVTSNTVARESKPLFNPEEIPGTTTVDWFKQIRNCFQVSGYGRNMGGALGTVMVAATPVALMVTLTLDVVKIPRFGAVVAYRLCTGQRAS